METILGYLGVALGIAGIVYAYSTNREKARLENLVKAELRGLAGNIRSIRCNPGWADQHFSSIQERALKLERNEDVEQILKHTQQGARDATAAERLIGNLLTQVVTFQEGMFGTRIIDHIDSEDRREVEDKT